jgi:uncharacterized protein YkwD
MKTIAPMDLSFASHEREFTMSKMTSAVAAILLLVVAMNVAIADEKTESAANQSAKAGTTAKTKSSQSPVQRPATSSRVKTVPAVPAVQLTEKEHRLVNAVNEYRERRGLPPLKVDPILMREARHAAPHYSHVINGKWCWHRCKARGFRGWYFKMNGRWVNYDFDHIGVGISGRKYIAIFGRHGIRH